MQNQLYKKWMFQAEKTIRNYWTQHSKKLSF